jgi:7-carboxy-7-deazaguanine synthase
MSYAVHEIFLTVQGEGGNIGRVAVFCRFAGCNLWSGREVDRAGAVCQFCDTDFVGGVSYETAGALAAAIAAPWPPGQGRLMCVLTGGEPLLQVDPALIEALHARGFYVAVETNGTQPLPCPVDWVCVSPKAGAPLALQHASELKLVYPQPALPPASLAGFAAPLRWLSPMDGPHLAQNVQAAATYCMAHPEWRLAIQAHKAWSLP